MALLRDLGGQPAPLLRDDQQGPAYQPDPGALARGFGSSLYNLDAGNYASQAIDAERAGRAADAARLADLSRQSTAEGGAYAPRVRSLRDIGGVGDAVEYLGGQLGQAPVALAPAIGGALAGRVLGGAGTAGKVLSYVGGLAGGYKPDVDSALAEQYADPQLAELPVEQRLSAARQRGAIDAATGALIPAGLANPGALRALGVGARGVVAADVLGQGAAGAAQALAHQRMLDQLAPERDRTNDRQELIDAAASNAILGGTMAAPHLAGHALTGGMEGVKDLGAGIAGRARSAADALPGRAAEPHVPTAAENAAGDVLDEGGGASVAAGDGNPGTLGRAADAIGAVADRFGPAVADQARTAAGAIKDRAEALSPEAADLKDAFKETAGKAQSVLNDRLDRITEAAKNASDPADFVRQAFGGDNGLNDMVNAAKGDDSDLRGGSLEETASNLANAAGVRLKRTTQYIQSMLQDADLPAKTRDFLQSVNPENRADQVAVARAALQERGRDAFKRAQDTLTKISDGFKSGMAESKMSMQEVDPAEQHAMSKVVFDHLTPEAKANPDVRAGLDELAQNLFRFTLRNGETLSPDDVKAVAGIKNAAADIFADPQKALSDIAKKGATMASASELSGKDSILSRAAQVGSASEDIGKANSYLYSSLTPEIKDTMKQSQLKRLADVVDQASLHGVSDETSKALARVFGGEDQAKQVLDYYQRANDVSFGLDHAAELAKSGITETETPDVNKPTYYGSDAKSGRPFLDMSDRTTSSGKKIYDANEYARNLQSQLGPGGKASVVPHAEALAAEGTSPEEGVRRIGADIQKRIDEHKSRLAQSQEAGNARDVAYRSEQLNRLLGEKKLLESASSPEEALRPYKSVKVDQAERPGATDQELSNYGKLAKGAEGTGITFDKTDGSKLRLSAESMWKSEGDAQGTGGGERTSERQTRLFSDALNKVLDRPDIKGLSEESRQNLAKIQLDRADGRTLGGTTKQRIIEALNQARGNEGVQKAILSHPAAARILEGMKSPEGQGLSKLRDRADEAVQSYRDGDADAREQLRESVERRLDGLAGDDPGTRARQSLLRETLRRMDSVDTEDKAGDRAYLEEPELGRTDQAKAEGARTPEGGYPTKVNPRANYKALAEPGERLTKFNKQEAVESKDPQAVHLASTPDGQQVMDYQRQMGERLPVEHFDDRVKNFDAVNKRILSDDPTIADVYSKMKPKPGRPSLSEAERDAIIKEVAKQRGPDVQVAFEKAFEIGGSGSYTYDPANNERLIKVAVNAKNPMSVAFHESLHDFFQMLSGDGRGAETRGVRKFLLDAANSGPLKQQLRGLLEGHPEALKQIETDQEERLAYAYQFWSEGKLRLGQASNNVFEKVATFIRGLFGAVSQDEKLADVFQQLNDGKLAEPNTVAAVLADRGLETLKEKSQRLFGPVMDLAEKINGSAADRMRNMGSTAATELADLFHKEPGRESGKLGFIQARGQDHAKFTNRLQEILANTNKTDQRTALENLQAMKAPSSVLEKQIASYLKDARQYMVDKGVMRWNPDTKAYDQPIENVKNYFPRVWDAGTIRSNEQGFKALLGKYGVAAGDADNIFRAITSSSDGQIDMADNDMHAGFTPYTQAILKRQLDFIDKTNAHEFAPFQAKDLNQILNTYTYQATHRGAFAEAFGNGGEKIQELRARAAQEGVPEAELRSTFDKGVQAMTGTLGYSFSPRAREMMGGAMVAQNVALLPMALFSSLIDPLGLAVRTGKFADAGKAFLYGMKGLARDLSRQPEDAKEQLARTLGLITDESMTDSMGQVYTSGQASQWLKNVNSKFFKWNGMETWNRRMRVASMMAGMRFLADNAGHDRYMNEMGLQKGDVLEKADGRLAITDHEILEANPKLTKKEAQEISGRVQQALYRFVDSTVLRPNAAQRPIWGSDPRFQLIFHMKQFTHSFQNTILKHVAKETEHGNMMPAVVLASYVPFMFAADIARGAITGKVSNWNDVMRVAGSSISRSGILGTGQFADDAWSDVKHGSVPGKTFLGPTFDNALTLVNAAAGRTSPHEALMRTLPLGSLLKAPITPTLSTE